MWLQTDILRFGSPVACSGAVETLLLTMTMAGTFGLAYAMNKAALALLLRAFRIDESAATAAKPSAIQKAPKTVGGFRAAQPAVSH